MNRQLAGGANAAHAARIATSAQYQRRREDWQFQYEDAQRQMDTLDKQMDALQIRINAATTSVQQAQLAQTQLKAMLTIYTARFTNAELYQWLAGRMAGVYQQTFNIVKSLCLSVQSCWQMEMLDFESSFFLANEWVYGRRGMLAGEVLKAGLLRMDTAFAVRNVRRYEITRTWSLKNKFPTEWNDFKSGKKNGRLSFDLYSADFEDDYKDQHGRQIRSISITLPTLLGPYQEIRAVLIQNSSKIIMSRARVSSIENLRPRQAIALSTGLDDAGVFSFNFGDERYLPFEGTGAISSWTFELIGWDTAEKGGAKRNF